ncbi:MAG: hypothetical protein PHE71_02365 [Candidatus Shapirobacteria bacterium]|nr:hypothetical protein [Candidatus Shapirobacteria bacterium]
MTSKRDIESFGITRLLAFVFNIKKELFSIQYMCSSMPILAMMQIYQVEEKTLCLFKEYNGCLIDDLEMKRRLGALEDEVAKICQNFTIPIFS